MNLAAITIEAKKNGLYQRQDGLWKLSLTIHPHDDLAWLLTAPMGQRLGMTIAALIDEQNAGAELRDPPSRAGSTPPVDAPQAPPAVKRPWHTLPLSTQAALLCQDEAFQEWLVGYQEIGKPDADETARQLRNRIKVVSRAELDKDRDAAARFMALVAQFRQEMGRETEVRG